MTVVLLLQMAPSQLGGLYHELAGIAFVALFVVHHAFNRGWVGRARRARGQVPRVNAVLDVVLTACVVGIAVSGALMSKHALVSLAQPSLAHVVRPLHACLSYAGLIVVSLHVGLHVPVVCGYARCKKAAWPWWARTLVAVVSLVVGAVAFRRLDVATKLSMGMSFPDGVTPLPFLLAWHIALSAPFVTCGSLLNDALVARQRTKSQE
ncbi:MAG: DUF4405 domain-containing protein [Coriobacteriales bacterium]|nr:DUF4405 domain-containing protein [Coriobacteriales bacterium]